MNDASYGAYRVICRTQIMDFQGRVIWRTMLPKKGSRIRLLFSSSFLMLWGLREVVVSSIWEMRPLWNNLATCMSMFMVFGMRLIVSNFSWKADFFGGEERGR